MPRCPQNPGRRCPARPLPPQGQALVRAALGIGMRQNVVAADLVVQSAEATAGLRVRPTPRSPTTCCVGLERRPLPPPGVPRLQRYYGPLRLPSAPGLSLTGL